MPNRVGQQLGNYRLIRFLGSGAFAEVYLSEHIYLKNSTAIKVLKTHLSEEDRQMFLVEAQTLAKLSHPHIVRVLDFGVDSDGIAFLVTEYVPRGTLRTRHPSGSCLALDTIASYTEQIAAALLYAHEQKLIHRDVKPENILVGSTQRVLLSDFGISLFAPSEKQAEVHEIAGTCPYMAPELFEGKPEFASDQYALGIMVYEWLCGKRPFQGNPLAIMYQQTHVPPARLLEHDPSLPQEVERVVLKALAKEPHQRYGSVQHFAQALGQACRRRQSGRPVSEATRLFLADRASTPVPFRRVLLSATHNDLALAMQLANDLQRHGLVVWQEQAEGAPEQPVQETELRQVLRAADVMLLVTSEATPSSPLIQQNLRLVGQYQRPLVCVSMTDTALSSFLPQDWPTTIPADLIDGRQQSYERTLAALLSYLEREGLEEEPALLELVGEPRSPYKGLRTFTQADAADFFGQDRLVEELIRQVRGMTSGQPSGAGTRLLAAIGPSGSGKSSVVRAGLLPRLQQGAVSGGDHWIYLSPMVPGVHPLEALALTLAPHLPAERHQRLGEELTHEAGVGLHHLASQMVRGPDQKVVLFIDQFEEIFTLTALESEREQFLKLLVTAATEVRGLVIILLALRADFYHRCMSYSRLHRLIEKHQKSVLPLEAANLRAVIRGPAALPDVQVAFEGNLVGELLFEVQEQAGALPLLQFTLEQLFLRRKGRLLTLQAYREIGGVRGALVRHAEAVYTALPSEQHRLLARQLFLRLVDPGLSEQDTTRRRAAIPELLLPDPQQTAFLYATAEAFIVARLLTTDDIAGTTTIEISHEALIREWTRLADWLRSARDDIRLQQAISAGVAEWQQRGKPDDLLYRGAILAEAEVWAKRQVASAGEAAFLQASAAKQQEVAEAERAQQKRELASQRRATNRLRWLASVLSVFLVVAVVLSSVAVASEQEAQRQAQLARQQTLLAQQQAVIANSRTLARQAVLASLQNQKDRASLLAIKAYQMNNNYDTRDTLLSVLLSSPRLETVLHQGAPPGVYDTGHLSGLLFGAGDQTLITSNAQRHGQIAVWDLASKNRHFLTVPPFVTNRMIENLAISPDGRILASEESDFSEQSSHNNTLFFIELWDLTTGKILTRLNTQGLDDLEATRSLAFSPDGKILVFGGCQQKTPASCLQGRVLLFDVSSGRLMGNTLVVPGGISNVTFTTDGARLAVAACTHYDPNGPGCIESKVFQWDVATRTPLKSLVTSSVGFVLSTVFSPDGKYLALGEENGLISLLNAATGEPVRSPLVGHSAGVTSLAFSPNSAILASGSQDHTVRLWSVSSGTLLDTLNGHASQVSQVAFSHDGQQLASASEDNVLLLWRINADTPISRHFDEPDLNSFMFSPDGKLFAISGRNPETGHGKKVILRDVATGKMVVTLAAADNFMFSPNGKLLAAVTSTNNITLWDLVARKTFLSLTAPEYQNAHIVNISFSADGKTLAAMADGLIILWDVQTGKRIGPPLHDTSGGSSPRNSDFLAFSSKDADVLASSQIGLFAFSRDGRFLAFSGATKLWNTITRSGQQLPIPPDGTTILWNVKEGKKVAQFSTGANLGGMAFSPNSQILATGDFGKVTLWNITTRKPLPQSLVVPFFPSEVIGPPSSPIAFSPDGTLIASEAGGTLALWDGKTYAPLVHTLPQINVSPVFSPDSHWLATIDDNGIVLWDVRLQTWQTSACAIAHRNLSQSEWDQFAASEPDRQICPLFPVHPSVVSKNLPGTFFAAGITGGETTNVTDRATLSAAFKRAVQISLQSNDPLLSDVVCWSGATEGFAREVLSACNHAVQLAPDNGNYHDSRGLARAMSGNTDGAIQDFEYFVNWARVNGLYTTRGPGSCVESPICKTYIQEREDWIAALKAFKAGGSAPFKNAKELLAFQIEKDYAPEIWMTYPEQL